MTSLVVSGKPVQKHHQFRDISFFLIRDFIHYLKLKIMWQNYSLFFLINGSIHLIIAFMEH